LAGHIGVTNDLVRRCYEHREKLADGFTRRYDVSRLVYFECFDDSANALRRETGMIFIRESPANRLGVMPAKAGIQ
jgi:predicted GIY-YIG superfamily endonuclease